MVSRRQFLRHAVSAGVVAAVGPSLLVKAVEAVAAPAAGGQLTYQALEETYQQVMLGHEEPDLIFVQDVDTYRRMVKLVQKINAGIESGRYRWETVSDADVHV